MKPCTKIQISTSCDTKNIDQLHVLARADMNIFFFVVLFFGAFGVIVLTKNLLSDERDRGGSSLEWRGLGPRSVNDDRVVQERILLKNFTPCSMVVDESLSAYNLRKRETARNNAVVNESGVPAVGVGGGGGGGDDDEAGADSGVGEGPHTSHKSEQSSLQLDVTNAVHVNTEWLQRTTVPVTELKAGTGTGMEAEVIAVGTDPETGNEIGVGGQAGINTGTGTGDETVTGNRAAAGAAGATSFEAPPGDFHVHLEMSFPGHKRILTAKDATWQNVSGTKHKFRVYSAFYDRRGNRTVRIFGASKVNGTDRVWCRLWYKFDDVHSDVPVWITNQTHSIIVPAKVQIFSDNGEHPYGIVIVLCALDRKLAVPSAVSVLSGPRQPYANLLLVRNTDADLAARNLTAGPVGGQSPPPPPDAQTTKSNSTTEDRDTIAVCVKPMHSKYNEALRILEFIELNAILGVQHFTIYNISAGDQVSCVLRDYIARGIVTILPWELDMSEEDIHTYGMFAALNDCVYRSMYKYKYTALFDVDEFIVPRNQSTLQELITWIDTHVKNPDVGSYSFQNNFFYRVWDDDPGLQGASLLETQLIILRKTRKSLSIYPHPKRAKYICRPEFVVEAGNHIVYEFVPGYGTFNVMPDVAILHHYRFCESTKMNCVEDKWTLDKIAYRYREHVVQCVRQRYSDLQLRCDLPSLLADPVTPTPTRPPPDVSKAVSRGEYATLLSPQFAAFRYLLLKIGFSSLLLLL